MDGDLGDRPRRSVATVMSGGMLGSSSAGSSSAGGTPDADARSGGSAIAGPVLVGGWSKRVFDVAVSGLALLATSPILLLIALLIRATSRGPALFWSERIGVRGESFMMPKFRTMTCDAPVMARELIGEGNCHVTAIGHFLRKTSLDELPQFIPVFYGKMSLIGPRPLLLCDPGAWARLKRPCGLRVRPGISGLAQVRGRNMLTPEKKARYDAAYVQNWSWRMDLMIIWQTVKYVILRKDIL